MGCFCELCKINYEKDKFIWNYEILLLFLKNEDMLDIFLCFYYVKKKLVCYCICCLEVVCIDCIDNLYNGYFVKLLLNVYKEFEGCFKWWKEEIEKSFFFKYRDLFVKEKEKWLVFIKRVDEI